MENGDLLGSKKNGEIDERSKISCSNGGEKNVEIFQYLQILLCLLGFDFV